LRSRIASMSSVVRLSARASSKRRCRPFFTGKLPSEPIVDGQVYPAGRPWRHSTSRRGVPELLGAFPTLSSGSSRPRGRPSPPPGVARPPGPTLLGCAR
jgi:hypothetical protein